jgi:hypothetical protein
MKRSEEIEKLLADKYSQRKKLDDEILDLAWERADIKMDLKPDYEVRVKIP